jgi:hypothetical protein
MKRLNRILSLALAAMMALTLLTGCGGKVTERAMEKAYGDYLRGQMGKPDMKVTYDVSPAVFEKIDADLRKNKEKWFNGTYLASYNAGEYFYVPWNTGTAGAGVAMLEDALKDYSTSVRVQFYAAKMPESAGNAITQAAYVTYCSRGGVRVHSNSSSDWTGVKVAVHRVQDGGDTYCYIIVIYEK